MLHFCSNGHQNSQIWAKNDTDATRFIGFCVASVLFIDDSRETFTVKLETHPILERSKKSPLLGRGFRGGMRM